MDKNDKKHKLMYNGTMLKRINVATIRELFNSLGIKDRGVRKLVVDSIYNGSWDQESVGSAWVVPGTKSLEEPIQAFIQKKMKNKEFNFDEYDSKLSEEASELLVAIR